ncbi:class I SAM-dependent methyltransferase [Naumannella halotolerans]|uniref:Methyltransferase family protein n=1 Tax=Naumannella halotolerans TaxID=993414 RepID=A0A4R7J1A5_9ACTN|nr:class I SAM-dependent methyltransferase [Naumannella halotolerans]TDT30921.1 methyltransferase family protein [Naumannella halotolerans]
MNPIDLLAPVIDGTEGFMPEDEGTALHDAVLAHLGTGLAVEIGTWCGRSTLYLLGAAVATGGQVVTIDHHRGSEEHQPGWEYHDESLVDPRIGRIDTLPRLRDTINRAGLALPVVEEQLTIMVGRSEVISRWWQTPIRILFIDGSHTMEAAQRDLDGWSPRIEPDGLLIIHDVFPDPADGGRPPYEIYRQALDSGRFSELSATGSLRVLQRR